MDTINIIWLFVFVVLIIVYSLINRKRILRKRRGNSLASHFDLLLPADRVSEPLIQYQRIRKNYDEELKMEIGALKSGLIHFDPPSIMTVGNHYELSASIFADGGILDTSVLSKSEVIKIGAIMRTVLKGDKFEIKSMDDESQIIRNDAPTIWKWDVMPLSSGNSKLVLKVSAKIKIKDYSDEAFNIVVHEKTINIKANVRYTTRQFLDKHGKFIINLLVGSGAIIAILKAFKVIP